MASTLSQVARQAGTDLRTAVDGAALPSGHPHPAGRRRAVVVLAVILVAVAFAATVLVRVTTAEPAGPAKPPSGFKTVVVKNAGFSIAVPQSWQDITSLDTSLAVYSGHDSANGAWLNVNMEDVANESVAERVSAIHTNLAMYQIPATDVPDNSSGYPGVRVEWDARNQHQTQVLFNAGGQGYTFAFRLVSPVDAAKILHTFRPGPLPAVSAVPMRTIRNVGFSVQVPAHWGDGSLTNAAPSFERLVNTFGVEGGMVVSRTTTAGMTLSDVVEQTRQALVPPGARSVQVVDSTIGGRPAKELTYTEPARDPRFVTAPGPRRIFVVQDGRTVLRIYFGGSDSVRSQQLLDRVIASWRFS